MPELKFELSEHELEFLHQIHNAQAIKELTNHPGWPLLQKLSRGIIGRMEDQHLEFSGKGTRDAYWLSGARLAGARTYAKLLMESVFKEVGVLDQDLTDPRTHQPELDGDFNGDSD